MKRGLDPEEEAKKKKRMERFGIVDVKAEAAAKAEAEVSRLSRIAYHFFEKRVDKTLCTLRI